MQAITRWNRSGVGLSTFPQETITASAFSFADIKGSRLKRSTKTDKTEEKSLAFYGRRAQ